MEKQSETKEQTHTQLPADCLPALFGTQTSFFVGLPLFFVCFSSVQFIFLWPRGWREKGGVAKKREGTRVKLFIRRNRVDEFRER